MVVENEEEFANVLDALMPEVCFVISKDRKIAYERFWDVNGCWVLAKVSKGYWVNQQSSLWVIRACYAITVRKSQHSATIKIVRDTKISLVFGICLIKAWLAIDSQAPVKVFGRALWWQNNVTLSNGRVGKVDLGGNIWSFIVKTLSH